MAENNTFQQKNSCINEPQSKKMVLGIVILTLILSINLVSSFELAGLLDVIREQPNLKQDLLSKDIQISESANKYPAVTIKTWWGLPLVSKDVMDIVLTSHDEFCGIDCISGGYTKLYEDGILFSGFDFYTILEDGTRVKQDIRNYQVYIKTNEEEYTEDVFEWQCNPTGKLNFNGTAETICSNVKTGTITKTKPLWEIYNIGEIKPAGEYEWELRGQKKPSRTVDFIPIVGSNNKIEDWATWGNISLGDDAEVILNSPANNYIAPNSSVDFNCSANVTGGATLTNMSFWHNGTVDTDWTFGFAGGSSYSSVDNIQWRAQGFNLTTTRTLDKVNVTVLNFSGSPGTCWVWISSNITNPAKNIISIATFNGSALSSTYSNITIDMPDVSITALQKYYLAMNCSAAEVRWKVANPGSFAPGYIIYSGNAGSSWADASTQDVNFYLETINATGIWALNQSVNLVGDIDYSFGFNGVQDTTSSVDNSAWRAMGFNITSTQTLDKINITIRKISTPGTCWVWISSNVTNQAKNIISLTSFNGNSIGASYENVTIDMPDISLTALQPYYWAMNCSASGLVLSVDADGAFPSGQIRYSGNAGASWDSASPQSATFRLGLLNAQTTNTSIFTTNIPQPTLWSCQACDSDGACGFATENRTVSLDTTAPNINITYPLNISYNINVSALNYTSDGINCWYSLNNGVTNSSAQTCGANWTGLTSSEGSNTWLVGVNDSANNKNMSKVTFFKDTVYPLISYGTGTAVNYANLSQNFVYINTTWTETNFKNITFSLYNSTWSNVTTYTTSVYLINFTNIGDGKYWYYVNITDTYNNQNSTAIYNITLDTIKPNITLYAPALIENLGQYNANQTLNWSISDTNFNSVWWEYNGTNTTLIGAINSTNFTLHPSLYNGTLWANDSAGNTANLSRTWDYKVFVLNETYVASTLSGIINKFLLELKTNGTQTASGYLNYNNTNILGTITSSGNYYNLTKNQIATNISIPTNISFYWNITMGDGYNFTITPKNQTVNPVAINATCGAGMNIIFNFTLKDEITQAKINGTAQNSLIKTDLDLYTSDRITKLNQIYNEFNVTNPVAICIDNNLSAGEQYSIDIQIQYSAANYTSEFYYIERYILNSSVFYNNITLYNLDTTNAQKFRLIARDTSYLPIEEALIRIERKYIQNGTFYITEIPKTDDKGITSASLQLNDVIYNFYIYKAGVLISSFTNVLAICQTPLISTCEIDFNAFQSEITIPNYEEGDDFNFTLDYNSTSKVVSSQFVIPSGEPSVVKLEVIREDTLGTAVCSDTLTSASGTLSCIVPSSFGNSTVLAKLYKDNVEQGKGNIKLDQEPSDIFGVILIMMSVLVMMTLIGVGISDNPIITAVFLFVGLILLFAMNLVKNTGFVGATATILFFAIAVIIVIIKAARRS